MTDGTIIDANNAFLRVTTDSCKEEENGTFAMLEHIDFGSPVTTSMEDAQLHCLLSAVGLRNATAPDIVTRLDIGGRRLHPGDNQRRR